MMLNKSHAYITALGLGIAALLPVPVALAQPQASVRPATTDLGNTASDIVEACAAYAAGHAADHDWACVGAGLTESWGGSSTPTRVYTDVRTGRAVDVTGLDAEASWRAATTVAPADTSADATDGPVGRNIIDESHAKNSEPIIWTINGHKGRTTFSYFISLHNHSANVDMRFFETSGVAINLQWRLRLRHDRAAGGDSTVFNYEYAPGDPFYGNQFGDGPAQSWLEKEGRYGDGYDQLPYEKSWKVFWDAHELLLSYQNVLIRPVGTIQSDRATCYVGVPCKFR